MGVSRNGYYEWLKGTKTTKGKRSCENAKLREVIKSAHVDSRGTYGRRRLAVVASHAELGFEPSVNRVERQMKLLGVEGFKKRSTKRTTIGDPLLQDSPNLVKDATLNGIDQIWVSDITYVNTKEGWLYLCTVMDLYSRKVVGWAMDSNMRADLVISAFDMAHIQRNPTDTIIFHSDKGGQYKSKKFRRKLKRLNYSQSMTGKDHCYDNAHAESFFGTLKHELFRDVIFSTRKEAESAIFQYVEIFYNRNRLHSSIGYQSPEVFEKSLGESSEYKVSMSVN